MVKLILAMALVFHVTSGLAQTDPTPRSKNVKIRYKKYQAIDLGDLEIKGKIIAPGDISIKERSRRRFSRRLFERLDFDPESREDILNIR